MKIATHDLNEKVFIIAELSANHNQEFSLAKKAIEVAKEAGCDAIKLQTYTPDSLTLNIKDEKFKAGDLWQNEYLYDLYARACMPYEWHKPLKEYADELGIIFFSSPFDFGRGYDLQHSGPDDCYECTVMRVFSKHTLVCTALNATAPRLRPTVKGMVILWWG